VKTLLILQQDSAYFLHETLQTLEKHRFALKDFEVVLLASDQPWAELQEHEYFPALSYVITDAEAALSRNWDVSVNFSLNQESWDLHHQIKSNRKLGPTSINNQLSVNDLWSTYLVTLKSGVPFLTFSLQEIYRRILGIKVPAPEPQYVRSNSRIVLTSRLNTQILPMVAQQKLFERLGLELGLKVKDLSEADMVSDLTRYIYIGPPCLEALSLCEQGATAIFLSSNFQGMNLMPHHGKHWLISAEGASFELHMLYPLITKIIQRQPPTKPSYPLYELTHGQSCGPFWRACGKSDAHYPIYQSHLVVWSFLLNLQEVTLEPVSCSEEQRSLLNSTGMVLSKLMRLHEYALASLDMIVKEFRKNDVNYEIVEQQLDNLREMDQLFDQIAASNTMLRPFLDFYRIRKGQVPESNLLEQAQETFLTYNEEHQALSALEELFSVTLVKNEVSI
jgi:hypothetical protein